MKMRILISNDDGIYSPGVIALARVASRFGEIHIVAPDVEQSSMGHAITSSRPLRYKRIRLGDYEAYRVNGTPADCVALGTHHWHHVDLVLSGINLGLNLGNSCWHSGTLAAAKQAALLGVRGIAFSTSVSENKEPDFGKLEPYSCKGDRYAAQGRHDAFGEREFTRETKRYSLDPPVRAAVRWQSCSEQRSNGTSNLLVHGYPAARSRGRNRPLGSRKQLGVGYSVAARSDRRKRAWPRVGASSHASNRCEILGGWSTKEWRLSKSYKRTQEDYEDEQEAAPRKELKVNGSGQVATVHRSAVRVLYSRELKLGTAELLQRHPVPGNFHLVDCRREWRFDFDSLLVTEFVPATHIPDQDAAVCRKLPQDCI